MGRSFRLHRTPRVCIEFLEDRRMLADDYGNDLFSASEIDFPAVVEGEFDSIDDQDWFRFSLDPPYGLLKITADTASATPIQIKQPDTRYVESRPEGCTNDCTFQWLAFGGPHEYLGIEPIDTVGPYKFILDRTDAAGNDIATAGDLKRHGSAKEWISPSDDVDVWRYNINSKTQYTWSVDSLDIDLQLVDEAGQTIAFQRKIGNTTSIAWNSPRQMDVFLLVTSSAEPSPENAYLEYEVAISRISRTASGFSSFATPRSIPLGGTTRVDFRSLEELWFRVDPADSIALALRLDVNDVEATFFKAQFDENNVVSTPIEIADAHADDIRNNLAGFHLLIRLVNGVSRRRSGEVEVNKTDDYVDSVEHAEVRGLTTGQKSTFEGHSHRPGDIDVLKFLGEEGVTYEASTNGPAKIRFSSSDNVIETESATRWKAPTNQEFWLEINGHPTTPWRVTIESMIDDFPDRAEDAQVLQLPTTVFATRQTPNDDDWYAFNIEAGNRYRLTYLEEDGELSGRIVEFVAEESTVYRTKLDSTTARLDIRQVENDQVTQLDATRIKPFQLQRHTPSALPYEIAVEADRVYLFTSATLNAASVLTFDDELLFQFDGTGRTWKPRENVTVRLRVESDQPGLFTVLQDPDVATSIAQSEDLVIDQSGTTVEFTEDDGLELWRRFTVDYPSFIKVDTQSPFTLDFFRIQDDTHSAYNNDEFAPGNYALRISRTEIEDAFFTVSLSYPPDDHGDTADTATFLTALERIEGTLAPGDSDWFAIDVVEGRTYLFPQLGDGQEYQLPAGHFDNDVALATTRTHIQVHGAPGEYSGHIESFVDQQIEQVGEDLVFHGSIDSPNDQDELFFRMPDNVEFSFETTTDGFDLEFAPIRDGIFAFNEFWANTNTRFIRARFQSADGGTGNFTANVVIHPAGNRLNSFDTATLISPQDSPTVFLWGRGGVTQQWYVMPVESGAQYRFLPTAKHEMHTQPTLHFFTGEDRELYKRPSEAGWYSVATNYSGYLWFRLSVDRAAEYTVKIEETFDQHGNAPETATVLSLPTDRQQGTLRRVHYEHDYFAIDAVANQFYELDINFAVEHRSDELQLVVLRATHYLRGRERILISYPETKRYYIRLGNGQGGVANDYTMDFSLVESTEIPVEANIPNKAYGWGADDLWYSVAMKAGHSYTFPTADVFYTDRTTAIGTNGPDNTYYSADDAIALFPLPGGRNPERGVVHSVFVREIRHDPPIIRTDEPIVDAPSLQDAIHVDGKLIEGYFESGSDVDWYTIIVHKGQIFDERSIQTTGIKDIRILNTKTHRPVSPIATEDGEYFVGVQGNQEGNYSIRFVVDPNGQQTKLLTELGRVSERFLTDSESVAHQIEVMAGMAYEVQLPVGSSHFQITDSEGNAVRHNDERATWRSSGFRWIASQDEMVTISVADITAPFEHDYELDIRHPYGDANLDGIFDSFDFIRVFTAAEYEDGIEGNSTWAEGDWDGDGDFTTSDLVRAFRSGDYVTGNRPAIAASPGTRASDIAFRLMAEDDTILNPDQDLEPTRDGEAPPTDPAKRSWLP